MFAGVETADQDAKYEDLYRRFSHLTLGVAELAANTARVREQLHELVVSQFNLAQNISDFYKEKRLQLREVERFKLSYQRVISSYWNTFVSTLYITFSLFIGELFLQLIYAGKFIAN